MMRSMFAGVSGLKVHQTKMDVIGNNIANVNTVGFKKSRVNFQDMLNQTLRGASAPQGEMGGINPMQIGLGVQLGSIDVFHTGGSPQSTGRNLDLSVEGDGYFVVGSGSSRYYTRAGNFDFDAANNLHLNGMKVFGWTTDPTSLTLDTGTEARGINLGALAETQIQRATSQIEIGRNLDSRTSVQSTPRTYQGIADTTAIDPANPDTYVTIKLPQGIVFDDKFKIGGFTYNDLINTANDDRWSLNPSTGEIVLKDSVLYNATTSADENIPINPVISYKEASHQTPLTIYDSLGNAHEANVIYYKSADNTWLANVTVNGELVKLPNTLGSEYVHKLEFTDQGQIADGQRLTITLDKGNPFGGEAEALEAVIDFSSLTQVATDTSALGLSQDGFDPGSLQSIAVDTSGSIVGTFSNGQNILLAQVALATFRNPAGLSSDGNTLFKESRNSGIAQIGTPGSAGKGIVKPETLEMSNVDLSQEFVEMIITQRGFQANSRIITTSDELLQELVNLKR